MLGSNFITQITLFACQHRGGENSPALLDKPTRWSVSINCTSRLPLHLTLCKSQLFSDHRISIFCLVSLSTSFPKVTKPYSVPLWTPFLSLHPDTYVFCFMSHCSMPAKYITAWKINSHTENNHRKEICFPTRLFSSCFNADNFTLKPKLKKKKETQRETLKSA